MIVGREFCRVGRVGVRQSRQHARTANRVPRQAQIQRRQQHDDVGGTAGSGVSANDAPAHVFIGSLLIKV